MSRRASTARQRAAIRNTSRVDAIAIDFEGGEPLDVYVKLTTGEEIGSEGGIEVVRRPDGYTAYTSTFAGGALRVMVLRQERPL